jgi:hypothetical protein
MSTKFVIRLREAYLRSGLSGYMVAKRTGISQNTVRRYILPESVIIGHIEAPAIELAKFFDVDWRDPAIIDVIEVNDEASPTTN